MNRSLLQLLVVFCFSAGLLFDSSCKKSEPAHNSSFTWTFNNGTTTTANIHKAFKSSMAPSPIIVASKGSNIISFDVAITLTSFDISSYTITGSGTNGLRYIDNSGNEYDAVSGTVNITSSSSNLISGNFSVVINGPAGGLYPVTGSFRDTPVEF